jgi:hypothetical protein
MTVDIARCDYNDQNPSLKKSFNYAKGRLGKFFLAALIMNLLATTIILLPASFYMYVIMVVDETGIREALSKGFNLSVSRIKTSVGLILLLAAIFMFSIQIPYFSDIVRTAFSTFIIIAAVDLYESYKVQKYLVA